ncbi:TPR-like protein [Dioscorea alata]|uniref:TPR-like protein n=1 Tax=Dioscorea alata TaxID=55571 RepID=A0ACB7TZ86_DIOAL|nr:TPR-like protein [Dioscorea alata]
MGSSALFSHANSLKRLIHAGLRVCEAEASFPSLLIRPYCSGLTKNRRLTLASVIYPLGHPSNNMATELDRWVNNGNRTRPVELRELVRDLRKRRRFSNALEVSEWMKDKGHVPFTPGDHAVVLDLIGRVRGLASAESYFNGMHERDKTEKTYGALLNCYVRECLVEKSLSHLQKMKEMGLATSALTYNDIMCLYTNTGQHEKVPSVLAEMKENGVLPDNFSYRICINSYGTRSDINGMEKLFEEMEHQPQIVVDWNTYSVVANIYIKAGLCEKAIAILKKYEEKLEKRNGLCYNHLVSLYGNLGMKSDIKRIWEIQKLNGVKLINRDYTTMIGTMVKLGDLLEAEILLKEWETSGNACDFRVPNVLLIGYRNKGLLEKAEELLDDFLKKGKQPPASSWGIVAAGYATNGETSKAYECMKNALCMYAPNTGWEPKDHVIDDILHWLGYEGAPADVETFVNLLKIACPMNRTMYHTLIRANVRCGKPVKEILKNMKADGIDENEETKEILNSKSNPVTLAI